MNDFDFEELDKAVSSLAAKTEVEHGGGEPSQPAVMIPSAAPAAPRPELSAVSIQPDGPADAPSIPAVASQKKPARLADIQPQRGRRAFMDIVPPATRKSSPATNRVVEPISRPEDVIPEGAKEEAKPELDIPQTASTSQVPEPGQTDQTRRQSAPISGQGEPSWPDPLDFDKSEDSGPDTQPPAEESTSSELTRSIVPEPETTSSTPFLSATKVEKRPLGAYSDYKPAEEPVSEQSRPAVSDELTPEQSGVFHEPQPALPEQPIKIEPRPEEPAPNDMHSTAMLSIPQQYRTADKTADNTTRSVYDTKEYHPPLLEATAHSHRDGMWVKLFIAVIVLVILVAAGYFVWFYLVKQVGS